MSGEQKSKMEQKIANEKHFVEMCKKYVAEIERYSGADPLDPWYRYMMWLEKNYVIDFSADSIFMDILCECLATFEADERYKQDRRMIKLFIKYISYQEEPLEHLKLMHANGVGTRVADLYICWAHWYNIVADFDHAEQIYQLGIAAKARSKSLLERAHTAFGANMSKRFLNKARPNYEDNARSTLQKKYNQFISLDLVEETTEPKAKQLHIDLREFHKAEDYAIPYRRAESALPATPERKLTTSLIKTIVNSCSARKKRLETRRSLHPPIGSRLDFGTDRTGYQPIPLADADNMYARGIQLPSNFARTNLPQRVNTVPPVRDDDLESTESGVLKVPTYDKIMLMPSADKSYAPEELMAYKWYKKEKIVNQFTTKMDALWSVGSHVPARRGRWLVKQNLPQSDDVYHDEFFIHDCGPIAEGIWRFAFDVEQHHPKDSIEEFSREELLRQKRIKSRKMGPRKPSSILQRVQCQKMQLAPQQLKRVEASPRPSTSQLTSTESNSTPCVAGRKEYRPEIAESTMPDVKKNRKTSYEFKELNDTCTTQSFGMFLKGHAVSTPNPKMAHNRRSMDPRCSVFVSMPDAMEEEPCPSNDSDIKLTAEIPEPSAKFKIFNDELIAAPMVDEKAAAGNLNFEIFTDETIVHDNANGEHDAKKNVGTKPVATGIEFEIYRDESKIMSEKIRFNAEKKMTQAATTHHPLELVNDENRPLDRLPSPCESIRSMAISSVTPLNEYNVAVGDKLKQQQISDLNYSFALTEVEKGLIYANSKKVNFSFDFAELNKPKMVEGAPLVDEEDSEENDLLGQSIYVPREEVVFSPAKHAEWPEVTSHLAEGVAAQNDYVAEPVDMNQTLQVIDAQLLDLMKLSPFNPKLQKALLDSLSFVDRLAKMDKDVCDMMKIVQPIKPRTKLALGKRTFNIVKMIGSGNSGNIFCGECCHTKSMLAFKQERPPNIWEYYICLEVHKRLDNQRIRNGCMFIEYALIGTNATIFASKFSPFGTLLQVCNKVKISTGRNMDEYVVMIFAKQMFAIVNALHRANLIHADIKPDNFLLMNPLDYDYDSAALAIQLIDFGQSIDMKLFPKNQVFYSKVKTENFVCTEMMDNRPWTFQVDLFCLASTIYTMVCGEYMVVRKANKNSSHYTTRSIPRYYNKKLWTHLFDVLINIPDPQRMPNMGALIQLLDDEIQAVGAKAIRQKIAEFNKALAQNI